MCVMAKANCYNQIPITPLIIITHVQPFQTKSIQFTTHIQKNNIFLSYSWDFELSENLQFDQMRAHLWQ